MHRPRAYRISHAHLGEARADETMILQSLPHRRVQPFAHIVHLLEVGELHGQVVELRIREYLAERARRHDSRLQLADTHLAHDRRIVPHDPAWIDLQFDASRRLLLDLCASFAKQCHPRRTVRRLRRHLDRLSARRHRADGQQSRRDGDACAEPCRSASLPIRNIHPRTPATRGRAPARFGWIASTPRPWDSPAAPR